MKFAEAMKIVKQYPELSALVARIRERTIEFAKNDKHCAGSWQFSVDGECFYFGYESYLDERDGKYHAEYARPFLEAGLPAFIDKPFTSDPAGALALAKLAKVTDVNVHRIGIICVSDPHLAALFGIATLEMVLEVFGEDIGGKSESYSL